MKRLALLLCLLPSILNAAKPVTFADRVKRYAEGYAETAGLKAFKIDRLEGLDCGFAFLIHPKSERPPEKVKQPLIQWARSQEWRGRLVVMEFNDPEELGDEMVATRFVEQIFPQIQGQQSRGMRIFRIDTTVIFGDADAIDRARR